MASPILRDATPAMPDYYVPNSVEKEDKIMVSLGVFV